MDWGGGGGGVGGGVRLMKEGFDGLGGLLDSGGGRGGDGDGLGGRAGWGG